jgi:hypothetical protein
MRYKTIIIDAQANDVDHNGEPLSETILHGVSVDNYQNTISSKKPVERGESSDLVTIPETHPFFNIDICSDAVDNLLDFDDSIFFGSKWERSITNIIKKWFPSVYNFYINPQ